MGGNRLDFFISHAGQDRAWAEWVAWQLADAGYTLELDVWDWAAGQNFVIKMSEALDRADRVVALFSEAYFEPARYTTLEWSSSLVHAPGAAQEQLVPVRVESVPAEKMPEVLRPLVFRDVFGLGEEEARQVLLEAVQGPARPDAAPPFPGPGPARSLSRLGGSAPRLPGSLSPQVWKVPPPNPVFAGRDGLLVRVRDQLLDRPWAQAQVLLQGRGGVGKTQLAIQYANQFAGEYDIEWWVDAENPELISRQLAELAVDLRCAKRETEEVSLAVRAALAELRRRDRWLLVFDNVENPDDVTEWLPQGTSGHVLITSRAGGGDDVATTVRVDVFARAESVAVLQARVPDLSDSDADRLAARLGDVPLAVRQAARYMLGTGTSPDEYIALLDSSAADLLGDLRRSGYPRSLAGVVALAVERLTAEEPAAAELVKVGAFLASEPEPIPPRQWFAAAAGQLPDALRARVADPSAFPRLLELISSRGLARVDHGLYLHRLTQAILRDQLGAEEAAVMRRCADAILAANDPGDPTNPSSWPAWARLLPHLLAVGPAATDDTRIRTLACWGIWYLLKRGDTRGGHDLASNLFREWRKRHSRNNRHTLWAASNLGLALREMGRYADARQLDEDTLARNRRIHGKDNPRSTLHSVGHLAADLRELGEVEAARDLDQYALDRRREILGLDHPDTLGSATALALDLRELGEVEAARDLDQDTLDRHRRSPLLGRDHPDTLTSARNLAADLRMLGEAAAARELDADTLARCRRVLGEDNPGTLLSASNLAADLRMLEEVAAAHDMDAGTLERRRRVLGEDHPDTLESASNLAADHRMLGELEAARELDADTLERRRQVLGEDHLSTLASAGNLAADLRELRQVRAARELDQDALSRRRRSPLLGPDHLDTLTSASNLAADHRMLGELEAARELDADTLERRRRVLGEDHLSTLASAGNLAADLRDLGQVAAARELDADTLERRRRVQGEDHPDTLESASNLAADHRMLEELEAARELDADTLERRRRVLGEDHLSTLASAGNLAADLRGLGESVDES